MEKLFNTFKKNGINFNLDCCRTSNFTIASKSGYSIEPNHFDFLHEISHLIQFTDDELQNNFIARDGTIRFKVPYIDVLGHTVCEPLTDQMSMREVETFYIQFLLECELIEKSTWEQWLYENKIVSLMAWLPDYYIFGIKNPFNLTPHEEDKYVKLIMDKSEQFKHWTYEKAMSRWLDLNFVPRTTP